MSSSSPPDAPRDVNDTVPGSLPAADDVRVRTSDRPPAGVHAVVLAEHDFVAGLRSVGLLGELDDAEHTRLSQLLTDDTGVTARRVDLLLTYYGSGGDRAAKQRREERDRFFWHTEESPTTIRSLVERIGALAPELGDVAAVWAGKRDNPVLRLRATNHIVDVPEEPGETQSVPGSPSISVRAVVRATNALLSLFDAPRRFVPLACDDERETYVGVSREVASMLCAAELVEELDEAELLALGGWES